MNKYRCATCHKPLSVDKSLIQVGDKVDFCLYVSKSTSNQMSVKMSNRTGKVTALRPGGAQVTYRGNSQWMPLADITPHDAPNNLTIAMQGMCERPSSEVHDGL